MNEGQQMSFLDIDYKKLIGLIQCCQYEEAMKICGIQTHDYRYNNKTAFMKCVWEKRPDIFREIASRFSYGLCCGCPGYHIHTFNMYPVKMLIDWTHAGGKRVMETIIQKVVNGYFDEILLEKLIVFAQHNIYPPLEFWLKIFNTHRLSKDICEKICAFGKNLPYDAQQNMMYVILHQVEHYQSHRKQFFMFFPLDMIRKHIQTYPYLLFDLIMKMPYDTTGTLQLYIQHGADVDITDAKGNSLYQCLKQKRFHDPRENKMFVFGKKLHSIADTSVVEKTLLNAPNYWTTQHHHKYSNIVKRVVEKLLLIFYRRKHLYVSGIGLQKDVFKKLVRMLIPSYRNYVDHTAILHEKLVSTLQKTSCYFDYVKHLKTHAQAIGLDTKKVKKAELQRNIVAKEIELRGGAAKLRKQIYKRMRDDMEMDDNKAFGKVVKELIPIRTAKKKRKNSMH